MLRTIINIGTLLICLLSYVSAVQAATPVPDVRILIDTSGSMKKNDPDNLRIPALRLLVGLLPEGSRAGIWTFGEWVKPLVAMGKVNDDWRNQAIKKAAKIHSWEQYTDIENALETVISDWQVPDVNSKRNIILLTDGIVDISKNPDESTASRERLLQQLLPKIKNLGAYIYPIGLSSGSDLALMAQLSASTNGWHEQVATADELNHVFLRIFEQSFKRDSIPLKGNKFTVDESIKDMTVLVFKKPGQNALTLITPSGFEYTANKHPKSVRWQSEAGFDLATLEAPETGLWQLDAAQDPDNRVMVVTNLHIQLDTLPTQVLAERMPMVKARLEYASSSKDKPPFLANAQLDFKLHDQFENPNQAEPITMQIMASKEDDDEWFSGSLEQPLASGVHELIITVNGGTFSRSHHHLMRVYNNILELTLSNTEDDQYHITAKALPEMLSLKSMNIHAFSGANWETIQPFEYTSDALWTLPIITELQGKRVFVRAKGEYLNGDPFILEQEFTIAAQQPEEIITQDSEPQVIQEELVIIENEATSWGRIGIFVVAGNSILALAGGIGFWLWRRKNKVIQTKDKNKKARKKPGKKHAKSSKNKNSKLDKKSDDKVEKTITPDSVQGDENEIELDAETQDVVDTTQDQEDSQLVTDTKLPEGSPDE